MKLEIKKQQKLNYKNCAKYCCIRPTRPWPRSRLKSQEPQSINSCFELL